MRSAEGSRLARSKSSARQPSLVRCAADAADPGVGGTHTDMDAGSAGSTALLREESSRAPGGSRSVSVLNNKQQQQKH